MKNLLILLLVTLILSQTFATSFLEKIYGGHQVNKGGYKHTQTIKKRPRTEKPRGRSYKDICRAVNPAPYAFPNRIPYPSVPIC